MYKYLIVAIAFMTIGGAAYYLNSADGDIVAKMFSKDRETIIKPTIESVAGVYVCDKASRCNHSYILLLKEDQTAEMLRLSEKKQIPVTLDSLAPLSNDETPDINTGIWDLDITNLLAVTFERHGEDTYDIPQKIVIKDIGVNTLSNIFYTKSTYTDMINPIFIRQK